MPSWPRPQGAGRQAVMGSQDRVRLVIAEPSRVDVRGNWDVVWQTEVELPADGEGEKGDSLGRARQQVKELR